MDISYTPQAEKMCMKMDFKIYYPGRKLSHLIEFCYATKWIMFNN